MHELTPFFPVPIPIHQPQSCHCSEGWSSRQSLPSSLQEDGGLWAVHSFHLLQCCMTSALSHVTTYRAIHLMKGFLYDWLMEKHCRHVLLPSRLSCCISKLKGWEMVFAVAEEMDYSCAQTGSFSRIQMGSVTLQPEFLFKKVFLKTLFGRGSYSLLCGHMCHILCTVAVYLPSVDNVSNHNLICFYYVMHHFWLQHSAWWCD